MVKNNSRAKRRIEDRKAKKKAEKVLKALGNDLTDKNIGRTASVHGASCSCHMCGNPRKYFKELTRQEKIAEEKQKEGLNSDNTIAD